jgi:hypothetical protein
MRAAHRPMRCNLIALSDFILDITLKIREGDAEHGNQPFETLRAIQRPTEGVMGQMVGG